MVLAPTHLAAIALAVLGLGLIVAAFVGETFGWIRLVLGIALVIAGMLTVGLHALARHGSPLKEGN